MIGDIQDGLPTSIMFTCLRWIDGLDSTSMRTSFAKCLKLVAANLLSASACLFSLLFIWLTLNVWNWLINIRACSRYNAIASPFAS
ncbi:putative PLAT/LH2 domain-containing protein [Helianthus annuus]|nr:putative PLAT/LH2 domain-containing protein [Helianthus annuus]